jgi:hypothetical protein
MKKNIRKSSALITLVLVPLNLLGLGFTGCDSRDDDAVVDNGADVSDEGVDFDATDPDDVFNLDPVPSYTGGPTIYPATQPLANSSFAALPTYSTGYRSSSYYHSGIYFVPVPYRLGYSPPMFSSNRTFSRSGVSRSYSSGSSFSHSSGTSRGGFGSMGHASASS